MRSQVRFETVALDEVSPTSGRKLRVTATIEDLPGMAGEPAVTIDKVEALFGGQWTETLDWEALEGRLEEEAVAEADRRRSA